MKRPRPALTRSQVMARVKGKNTKPELRVRRALWQAGLRYRLHAKDIPGRPDIVFRGLKVAVFVHGCFWHRHPGCEHARLPKSRLDFWEPKLEGNARRDAAVEEALERAGWASLTVWECETRKPEQLDAAVARIAAVVASHR